MSTTFDPFNWDLNHAQTVQPAVATQHAVKASLVTKAIDLLNRPPSGGRDRPPELATLDTPPSSCEPPSIPEDASLLKPPTVPSQVARRSLSPTLMPLGAVRGPFTSEGESMRKAFKTESSPIMGNDPYASRFRASGHFDIFHAGATFEAMTIGEVGVQNSVYLSSPSFFSDTQSSSSSAGQIACGPTLEFQSDASYDGDVALGDMSLSEYLCKLESPEVKGFDACGAVQTSYPSEEPALVTGSSASEYSIATDDNWFRMLDPVGDGDALTVPSSGDSGGGSFYEPVTFSPPPLSFPSPVLPIGCNPSRDVGQLNAGSIALENASAGSSAFVADKVSLYHAPQQSNCQSIITVPSQPVAVSIAPAPDPAYFGTSASPVPADDVEQAVPVKSAARGRARKVTVNRAPIKIRISKRQKQVGQPQRSQVTIAPAARMTRCASPDCSDSDSTVVPSLSHAHSSSIVGYNQQHLPSPPLHFHHHHQQQQPPFVHFRPPLPTHSTGISVKISRKPLRKPAARRAPRKSASASKPAAPKRKRTIRPRSKPIGPAIRYPCLVPGCGKTFSSPHNLQEHGQVHDATREREFKCPLDVCRAEKREYFFRRDLRRHNRKRHLETPGLVDWLERWADEEAEKRALEKERKRLEEDEERRVAEGVGGVEA